MSIRGCLSPPKFLYKTPFLWYNTRYSRMRYTTMTTSNEPCPTHLLAATFNTLRLISSYCPALCLNPIFNEELLANTRLSQRPTAGVLVHIEDGLAGVQRSSRRKKPLKNDLFTLKGVQNEPNLNNSKIAVTPFMTERCAPLDTWYRGKNEPNTNPNEPIFSKPNKLVLRGDGCYDDYLNLRHIRRF